MKNSLLFQQKNQNQNQKKKSTGIFGTNIKAYQKLPTSIVCIAKRK